ncbi:MAG: cupin domain-containing protein [Psychroserpens sp.]|uniref:cupin domain-containing protein n=1 Tax=Psychroserpens sp. TaxID=2020870 RepID=UPI003C77E58F
MRRNKFLKTMALGAGAFSLSSFKDIKSQGNRNKLVNVKPKIVRDDEGQKLLTLGDNQTIKLKGEDTNGQFTLIEELNEPGIFIPPHVHSNEDEVFHVISGSLEVTVGSETTILGAGDMVFCPREIPHSWKTIGPGKTRVFLSIFPSGLENLFTEISKLPSNPPDIEKVMGIAEKYKIKFI